VLLISSQIIGHLVLNCVRTSVGSAHLLTLKTFLFYQFVSVFVKQMYKKLKHNVKNRIYLPFTYG